MIEDDLFGLESERRIIKSGVRNIFTPHTPVKQINLFKGRQKEVQSLIGYLNTPGQHALLYGNRGIGKSSLANITGELILKHLAGGQLIRKRCDSSDSFTTIVEKLVSEVGIDIHELSSNQSRRRGVNKVVNLNSESSTEKDGAKYKANSPSWVCQQVLHLQAIFIIDEVDSIREQEEKKKIAELIKQLSDEGSNLKILVVGIAETSNELTAGHPSVARCLKEVKLANMKPEELREILTEGANKLNISFDKKVINKIITLSSRYPHFTHLLGLKAAEEVIIDERRTVTVSDLNYALGKAIDDVEGTLRNQYQSAIRSSKENYKEILLAAAVCPEDEIKAKEIRDSYQDLFSKSISQLQLNNSFQRLVSDDNSAVLRRLAKGIYKFNDPRMPSFIKIAQKYLT